MLISELKQLLSEKEKIYGNIPVKCVCPMNSGFMDIGEILHRSDYYDTTTKNVVNRDSDKLLEVGNFIAMEMEDELI